LDTEDMALLLPLFFSVVWAGTGDLKLLDGSYSNARCLDGSQGGYYYRAGKGENTSKFVILLQGGGECVTKDSCTERAGTALGSSKFFKKTMNLKGIQGDGRGHKTGEQNNPDFGTWTQIFIPYCSGDLHMGQATSPSNTTWGLQFSGHMIVKAVIEESIKQYKLDKARAVIFSGESAGGLGCFANMDFVRETLPAVKKFAAVPIGGFYFSNEQPYTGPGAKQFIPWSFASLKAYYSLWDAFVPTACAQDSATADEPWKCMFAVASYKTLKTPIFVVEAQTDKVVMPLHDGLPLNKPYPTAVLQYMSKWAHNMTTDLAMVTGSGRGDGLFNPGCLIHTSFKVEGPFINNLTYLDAIGNWMFKRSGPTVLQDHCPPGVNYGVLCNPCAGQ